MALPAIAAIAASIGGVLKVTAAIGVIMVTLLFIGDWLKIFPDWLANLAHVVLEALGRMLKDILLWAFDKILELVVSLLNSLELDFTVFNPATYIGGLTPDVVNIINLIRLPEALGIIVSAIVLKVILQLIPFTRLGS